MHLSVLRRAPRTLHRRLYSTCTKADCHAPTPPSPTPLQQHLHRQISFHGPITLATYMRTVLTHPTHGYYTTSRDPISASGDFITSPEISPIFSELLAVWIAHFQSTTPTSPPYHLVELGPGTGALLAAALPVLHKLSAAPESVTLVEASPRLEAMQREALSGPNLPRLIWARTLDEVLCAESVPTRRIFILHEFLDALPVHAFDRVETGTGHVWRERLVDIDERGGLRFVRARMATAGNALLERFGPRDGARVHEVGAEAAGVVERIGWAIREGGGAGIIVDYGRRGVGDSVRGFEQHRQVDVLHRPGLCDVTGDVDFGQLGLAVGEVGGGVFMTGTVSQREFLLRMGVAERFRRVGLGVVEWGEKMGVEKEVVDGKLEILQVDYERLVGRTGVGMGEDYQVAAVVGKGEGDLAGGLL